MFCQNCGKEIADDAAFCPVCGKQIKGKKSRKKFLIGGIIIFVIIIAFCAVIPDESEDSDFQKTSKVSTATSRKIDKELDTLESIISNLEETSAKSKLGKVSDMEVFKVWKKAEKDMEKTLENISHFSDDDCTSEQMERMVKLMQRLDAASHW